MVTGKKITNWKLTGRMGVFVVATMLLGIPAICGWFSSPVSAGLALAQQSDLPNSKTVLSDAQLADISGGEPNHRACLNVCPPVRESDCQTVTTPQGQTTPRYCQYKKDGEENHICDPEINARDEQYEVKQCQQKCNATCNENPKAKPSSCGRYYICVCSPMNQSVLKSCKKILADDNDVLSAIENC